MKHYLYFLFLLICISINAQTVKSTEVSESDTLFLPKLTGQTYIERKGYKGEQYFYDDWVDGDILLSTGEMLHGEKLKYNGLFDELIWVNMSNYRQFELDKSFVAEFWLKGIRGATIHFKRINLGEQTDTHPSEIYAQIGVEEKVSLYIQRKISVVGDEDIYENGKLYNIKSIESKPLYYIKLPSNNYLVLRRIRRNAFLKLFPEQKKTILKLIRAGHLNFKSEADLIKVIELMNEKGVI
ncbi:MAG: hypothetical protein P4L34_01305 [Paludibacter sp.]|nr:hypothetical protein [Paludibacter sp.]